MSLNLKPGETILFRASDSGLIENNPPFFQGIMGRYDYAQGVLFLTNMRLLFIGDDIKREAIRVGMKLKGVRFHHVGTHNFEAALGEIEAVKACAICGIWPIGIHVSLKNGGGIYFSLFGRKKLLKAMASLK